MIMRKEQVNLGSIERSNVMLTISYILLIIVSDCNRLNKKDKNIPPAGDVKNKILFIYFDFPKKYQQGFEP